MLTSLGCTHTRKPTPRTHARSIIRTMDFTDQYPFPQQAFNAGVMNIPPLTPSHSQSAPSEDFTSPPVRSGSPSFTNPARRRTNSVQDNAFAQLGADFTNFDYTQGLGAGAFPGPPTPPNAYSQKNGGPATNASPEDSGARGGSEEDDLTPAQSRRKAQNRAACVFFFSYPKNEGTISLAN